MQGYAPILLLLMIAVSLPVLVWTLSRLLRPDFYSKAKYSTYECGITPVTEAREKFNVRYYLIAVMFLVFDVESVFLFPWALQMKELALFGLVEMGIFLFLLLFGYGYIWSKGALTWE
ncbi:MAG: NADH-quinone oxidoreductase subunit A [Holophagaceae bacterium]|nr:NADH-quinone oxidoreductase subunit A [Holophagaceae bacterium]